MNDSKPVFDPADERHVGLWDELPLWSAMAGLLLLEHVPLNARRVLDLGCGSGFPTLELAERLGSDARVTGIDPWRQAIRRARAKRDTWPVANADLVRGDAGRLPFRDATFDLIVSNLGLNNFSDPDAALGECCRVLRSDGGVALATNLVGHFAELYEVLDEVLAGDEAARGRLRRHVTHRATIPGLTRSLERHGLRVTDVHERSVAMRFHDGQAVLGHHFIRLGFLPEWIEAAGTGRATERLAALCEALDRRFREQGEVRLTVPFAYLLARP